MKQFQDDVETINVVLNPDKVWDADELDQHFDTVAGITFKHPLISTPLTQQLFEPSCMCIRDLDKLNLLC